MTAAVRFHGPVVEARYPTSSCSPKAAAMVSIWPGAASIIRSALTPSPSAVGSGIAAIAMRRLCSSAAMRLRMVRSDAVPSLWAISVADNRPSSARRATMERSSGSSSVFCMGHHFRSGQYGFQVFRFGTIRQEISVSASKLDLLASCYNLKELMRVFLILDGIAFPVLWFGMTKSRANPAFHMQQGIPG